MTDNDQEHPHRLPNRNRHRRQRPHRHRCSARSVEPGDRGIDVLRLVWCADSARATSAASGSDATMRKQRLRQGMDHRLARDHPGRRVALFFFVANSDSEAEGDVEQAESSEVVDTEEDDTKEDDGAGDDSDKGSKDDGKAKGDESSDSGDSAESGGDAGGSDAANWFQDLLDSIAEWLSGLFGSSDSGDGGDVSPDAPEADAEQ